MLDYLTQIYTTIVKAIKLLDVSFEAGDLIEVEETVEYVEAPQMPPEIVHEILTKIEDPTEIANLIEINRTWYKEGNRLLIKNKEKYMNWLRLNYIYKLDDFIRYLKLDRLDEYKKISYNLGNLCDDLDKKFKEVDEEKNLAYTELKNYEEININYLNDDEDLYEHIIEVDDDYFLVINLEERHFEQYNVNELINPLDERHKELFEKYKAKMKKLEEIDRNLSKAQVRCHEFRRHVKFNVIGVDDFK